jgi:hypothetical protein
MGASSDHRYEFTDASLARPWLTRVWFARLVRAAVPAASPAALHELGDDGSHHACHAVRWLVGDSGRARVVGGPPVGGRVATSCGGHGDRLRDGDRGEHHDHPRGARTSAASGDAAPVWGWLLVTLYGADMVARLMHAHTTSGRLAPTWAAARWRIISGWRRHWVWINAPRHPAP